MGGARSGAPLPRCLHALLARRGTRVALHSCTGSMCRCFCCLMIIFLLHMPQQRSMLTKYSFLRRNRGAFLLVGGSCWCKNRRTSASRCWGAVEVASSMIPGCACAARRSRAGDRARSACVDRFLALRAHRRRGGALSCRCSSSRRIAPMVESFHSIRRIFGVNMRPARDPPRSASSRLRRTSVRSSTASTRGARSLLAHT